MGNESSLRTAILIGTAELACGFGTLFLLWSLGDWPENVPGLWDYRSATVGDGVLLPLIVGLLVAAGSAAERAGVNKRTIWVSATLSALVGAGIQVIWLLDPSPQLNWGVPSPGNFNIAGTYHAAFFVLSCGVIAGLVARMVMRLRRLRTVDPSGFRQVLDSPFTALLIAASTGFVGLVALDGRGLERFESQRTVTSLSATLSGLAALLLVAALLKFSLGGHVIRLARRSFLWGAVLATSLLIAAWRPRHYLGDVHIDEWIVVIVFCVLTTFQLWVRRGDSVFWWIAAASAAILVTAGAGFCLVEGSRSPVVGIVGVVLTWLAILLSLGSLRTGYGKLNRIFVAKAVDDRTARLLVTAYVVPLTLLVLAGWLGRAGLESWSKDAVGPTVAATLGAIGFLGTKRYLALQEQDNSLGPGTKSEENAWAGYVTILGLFYTTLLAVFAFLRECRSLIELDPPVAHVIAASPRVALLGCVALFIALLGARTARPTRRAGGRAPSFRGALVELTPASACLTVAALVVWASAPWISSAATQGIVLRPATFPNIWWEAVCALFAFSVSAWIGYTSSDSIHANVAEIELLRLSSGAWVVVGVAGLTTASTASWVFVAGGWSGAAPARVDSLAFATSVTTLGNLAILTAVSLTFARSWPRLNGRFPYMGLHHAATHVANDHFLQTALLFITVTTAYVSWRALLSPPKTLGDFIVAVGAVAGPFAVARAFVKALDLVSNEHLEAEGRRVDDGKAENILVRAGGDITEARRLNEQRLALIRARFTRVQRRSKFLALWVPAVLNTFMGRWF